MTTVKGAMTEPNILSPNESLPETGAELTVTGGVDHTLTGLSIGPVPFFF